MLVIGCRHEPVEEISGSLNEASSVILPEVVRLDTLVYSNPQISNNQVRFDLLAPTQPLPSGTVFYYPGRCPITGRVDETNQTSDRVVLTIESVSLFDLFQYCVLSDTIMDRNPVNESWQAGVISDGDSVYIDSLSLVSDNGSFGSLSAYIQSGTISLNDMFRFFLSTGLSDTGSHLLNRISGRLSFNSFFRANVVAGTDEAVSGKDSVWVGTRVYGPVYIQDLPVFFYHNIWAGIELTTEREGTYQINAALSVNGSARFHYESWAGWANSTGVTSWEGNLDSVSGPVYAGYVYRFFITSSWVPVICGSSLSRFEYSLNALVQRDFDLTSYVETHTTFSSAGMAGDYALLKDELPAFQSAETRELSRESRSGALANLPPTASFGVSPAAGYTDTNFKFDASASTDLEDLTEQLQVRWDFNGDNHYDTEYSYDKVIFHQYAFPGSYDVVLEVTDRNGLTDYATTNVRVELSASAPIAFFTINPETGRTNNYFVFDASGSYDSEDPINALKVRWDFENDGLWNTAFSVNKAAVHYYTDAGTYVIKMEIIDTDGLTGSTTKKLVVLPANVKPTAHYTVIPENGTTETIFSFDAGSSSDPEDAVDDLLVRWDWENDGVWDTEYRQEKTIRRRFVTAGEYQVVLEVEDTEGFASTYSSIITVTDPNTPPTADFVIQPASGTVDTTFVFDASLSTDHEDAVDSLEVRWDWDNDDVYDTDFTTDKVIHKKFSQTGTFIIKVQVRDSGGLTDTKARLLVIN
ncbi:MAG: PKD domain-containing protein [Bacteroidales bacterium]|nr:PKD domain-containing protein [Bacteroidales bacterium]